MLVHAGVNSPEVSVRRTIGLSGCQTGISMPGQLYVLDIMKRVGLNLAMAGLLFAAIQTGRAQTAGPADIVGARPGVYDPRAIRLLQQMGDAYAHLSVLQQETEFTSAVMPLVPIGADASASKREQEAPAGDEAAKPATDSGKSNPEQKLDRRFRLSFAAPNRLRMEMEDKGDGGLTQVSQWVSDGKWFWTYSPEKNLYSKEKAPGRIQDFARLAHMSSGSLEMLMLMGINPFEKVEDQTESVRYGGTDSVRGTAVDIVVMSADLGPQLTETRLFIGRDDHLLYRLVSETAQKIVPPHKEGVGSPLDELAAPKSPPPVPLNPDEVAPAPGIPMKSRVTYENKINLAPVFDSAAFAYSPPKDALFLNTPDPHHKPPTLKQRLAELAKANRKANKKSPPRTIRF